MCYITISKYTVMKQAATDKGSANFLPSVCSCIFSLHYMDFSTWVFPRRNSNDSNYVKTASACLLVVSGLQQCVNTVGAVPPLFHISAYYTA
jgi:hypothetical protein